MASIAPPQLVAAPPRQALPYGIFSAIDFRPDAGHWRVGVQWERNSCHGVDSHSPIECENHFPGKMDGVGPPDLEPNAPVLETADSFAVMGSYSCLAGSVSMERAQQLALENLEAGEEARVGQVVVGNLIYPNSPPIVEAQPPALLLGELESRSHNEYGFNKADRAVFHMDRKTATVLLGQRLLQVQGDRLMTLLGTPVVAGIFWNDGALGGPYGHPEENEEGWIYSTPPLFGYRSAPEYWSDRQGDLMDRGKNIMYTVATRTYVVGHNSCGIAAGRALLTIEPWSRQFGAGFRKQGKPSADGE